MNADDVRAEWAGRAAEYSPGYYAYYGPNETSELVRQALDRHVPADGAVVELGCSAGRHLAHLHDAGYGDLAGVDINDDAFDVLAAEYPALSAAGTFHHGAIEDVVTDFADGQFDAVYSVETLQHLHADEAWVFAELVRVTDDVLLTVECERTDGPPVNYDHGDFPLYYRDWERIFTDLGLELVETESVGADTLRLFRQG